MPKPESDLPDGVQHGEPTLFGLAQGLQHRIHEAEVAYPNLPEIQRLRESFRRMIRGCGFNPGEIVALDGTPVPPPPPPPPPPPGGGEDDEQGGG